MSVLLLPAGREREGGTREALCSCSGGYVGYGLARYAPCRQGSKDAEGTRIHTHARGVLVLTPLRGGGKHAGPGVPGLVLPEQHSSDVSGTESSAPSSWLPLPPTSEASPRRGAAGPRQGQEGRGWGAGRTGGGRDVEEEMEGEGGQEEGPLLPNSEEVEAMRAEGAGSPYADKSEMPWGGGEVFHSPSLSLSLSLSHAHTHTQVTDACLGWDETEKILKAFSRAVKTFRERESQEAAARREQMAGTRTGGQDPNGKMMKAFSRIQQH